MAALPYMQLYVADYLADTSHLSTLEHGAYLLLIMNYWQRGKPLPAADDRLARICRMTAGEWDAVRDNVREFFTERDGLLYHKEKYNFVTVSRPSPFVWNELRTIVFNRDDYTCQYCGKRGVKLECDHIHPISRGGSNRLENLTTACKECNRSKRAKTLEEWRQS